MSNRAQTIQKITNEVNYLKEKGLLLKETKDDRYLESDNGLLRLTFQTLGESQIISYIWKGDELSLKYISAKHLETAKEKLQFITNYIKNLLKEAND